MQRDKLKQKSKKVNHARPLRISRANDGWEYSHFGPDCHPIMHFPLAVLQTDTDGAACIY